MEGQELAARHIALREQAGLTQEQEAKAAGVSPTTISGIESGKIARPHLKTLLKLARSLGVDVGELRESGKAPAPKSPREWLRAHGALLLSLTEDELRVQYAALYPGDSVKFSDRIDREWETIQTEWTVNPLPNPEMMREVMALAESRYFQGKDLAPISNSYDPDNPERQEQITIHFELPKKEQKEEVPTSSGRKGRDNTG